jgi:rhodanese-related sulfurtransferase
MIDSESSSLPRGILMLCGIGILLGISYNYIGLSDPRGWGLSWIAEDKVKQLADGPSVSAARDGNPGPAETEGDEFTTNNTDPFAIATDTPDLPEIPAIGRPVNIELDAVELYVDAGAALIIDAREPEEYAAGHLPGAISLPYEKVITDPAALESLDVGNRPIIAYCGGGECEVSLSLAHELIALGYERVAVYTGGYPEWEASGLPVARAGEDG